MDALRRLLELHPRIAYALLFGSPGRGAGPACRVRPGVFCFFGRAGGAPPPASPPPPPRRKQTGRPRLRLTTSFREKVVRMAREIKAAVMTAPGKMEVQRLPWPDLERGAVLLQMEMSGICGTDKHAYRGEATLYAGTEAEQQIVYPTVHGHQNVGTSGGMLAAVAAEVCAGAGTLVRAAECSRLGARGFISGVVVLIGGGGVVGVMFVNRA